MWHSLLGNRPRLWISRLTIYSIDGFAGHRIGMNLSLRSIGGEHYRTTNGTLRAFYRFSSVEAKAL